jgi:diacylglycerol kinase (ATP)
VKFRFIRSLNYAIEGILHAARTQRHIRYHLFAALLLLLACFVLGINFEQFIILTIMATVVIVSEIINSAIEEIVNIVSPRKNEKARVIKDMAAGAVLVVSSVSLIVGYFILVPYIRFYAKHGISIAKHTGPDIAIGSIIILMILVIVIKAYTGKGLPLRGGMPSGHSAFFFSIWVSVTYTTRLWYMSLPLFILAMIVAVSRVYLKIHTVLEVIAGAILGIAMTLILYRLFY